jgi:hypothetical protein
MVKKNTERLMKLMKLIYFLTILTISFSACGQSKPDRQILGRKLAEQELKSTLSDKSLHNVVINKENIIKDSLTAINIAEQILFGIYGKDQIRKQLPYETYFIDNYWVISGTLPRDYVGGTFLIILDARDSRVLRITHGK